MTAPHVFISYSHDSDEHRAQVLGIATKMREDGIAAKCDHYIEGSPDAGWPRWMLDEIEAATYVLVVCTPTYYRRFRGHEVPGKGRGSDWEGAIITQELYDTRSSTAKFVPLLVDPAHEASIPEPLRGFTRYTITSSAEYHKLCQFLRGEAGVLPSPVIERPPVPRSTGRPIEFNDAATEGALLSTPRKMTSRSGAVWGRDTLLTKLIPALKISARLVLFGMRGIGKSRVIETIMRCEPWSNWGMPLHVFAGATRHHADVFRTFAQSLGISDENPRPPMGSVEEIVAALEARAGRIQPTLVWIDQAQCWFDSGHWANPELGRLVAAIERMTGGHWKWMYEFREHPPELLRQQAFEVPGLDKRALADWLQASAPEDQLQEWTLSGDQLKAMYQWLGGGHGQQAHPLATSLLIEVALGTRATPLQVRQRLIAEPARQIENLLSDLFENVLSEPERQLLLALALYRDWIPHDHFGALEAALGAKDAWVGLERRCLLPSDEHQERYFLHGFVSGWLRQKLACPADDSDRRSTARGPAAGQHARELHSLIADCWLRQLEAPRRFVWNPTVRIVGRRRARWACGQAAFEPVHMSTGRLSGARI